jgi:hypothetical protein
LLSAGTLGLGGHANSDEPVLGLELLHGLGRVIDKGETSGLATTEVGAETEDGDLVLLGLVEATELLAELLLGDVGAVGVEDITAKTLQSAWCFSLSKSSGHRVFVEVLPPIERTQVESFKPLVLSKRKHAM